MVKTNEPLKAMDKAEAVKILGRATKEDGSLESLLTYISWSPGDHRITLDGEFTCEEVKAIAWWMDNH